MRVLFDFFINIARWACMFSTLFSVNVIVCYDRATKRYFVSPDHSSILRQVHSKTSGWIFDFVSPSSKNVWISFFLNSSNINLSKEAFSSVWSRLLNFFIQALCWRKTLTNKSLKFCQLNRKQLELWNEDEHWCE